MIDEMKKYFDEIIKDAKRDDCSHIDFPIIVDKPTGIMQTYDGDTTIFSHIFIDQKVGCCEDDYYGNMYYPIEDKYLKVGYVL